MKIAVTGPRGTLGSQVAIAVASRGHVLQQHTDPIEQALPSDLEGIDVLINCAGIVKQRIDKRPSDFASVNTLGPHWLAEACRRVNARLVHVSTDCVFGQLQGPHDEDDIPTPEEIYAATKLAGEVTYGDHLTVRCSFVGIGPRGLVHDIVDGVSMKASGNFMWNGHTAETVALALVKFAEWGTTGLIHLPGQEIDRYALVRLLCSSFDLEVPVERNDDYARDRRLSSRRHDEIIKLVLPPFAAQVTKLAEDLQYLKETA